LTLLDAYALVALVADEPAADEVEELLRAGDSKVVIVNLAEAIDISQRVLGYDSGEVRSALEPLLLAGALEAISSDEQTAWSAAELRARHYDRKTCALSMADCFLLAHALAGEAIATADPPFAAAARAEGIDVVALPDAGGNRP
jgi:predicted nucleic acid-binding protein